MKYTPLLLCLALLGCNRPDKGVSVTTKIDTLMQDMVRVYDFNGNVLIASNDSILYQKSFGLANYDTGEKLNDSSVFELASISKQFTAMGIMMLKEEGKLSLEDNCKKFIPELPYEGITIRHLLTHTSGLPEYEVLFDQHWDRSKIGFNKDVINLLVKYKPPVLFPPGEQWVYCNTAYVLLAVIIERVSGKPFGAFLAEKIFTPLKMSHTRTYNTRRSNEVIPNYAYGFVYSDSRQKYVLPDSIREMYYVYTLDGIEGDGIVNSTTGDLYKWDRALYTDKLVKLSTLQEAFTPVTIGKDSAFNYGFGWNIDTPHVIFGKVVHHGGGWPGYRTNIMRFLDKGYSIIALSNNENRVTQVVQSATAILFNLPFEKPRIPTAANIALKVFDPYLGSYKINNIARPVRVWREEEKLFWDFGGNASELLTESATRLFSKSSGMALEFNPLHPDSAHLIELGLRLPAVKVDSD